jgi:WD40 repeat protein
LNEVLFSADGEIVVAGGIWHGSSGANVLLWDRTISHDPIVQYEYRDTNIESNTTREVSPVLYQLTLSPDGRYIAAASAYANTRETILWVYDRELGRGYEQMVARLGPDRGTGTRLHHLRFTNSQTLQLIFVGNEPVGSDLKPWPLSLNLVVAFDYPSRHELLNQDETLRLVVSRNEVEIRRRSDNALLHTFVDNSDNRREFSPDNRYYYSFSYGGFDVNVWDISQSDPQQIIYRNMGQRSDAAISPDSRWLAAVTYEGRLFLWELPR